jgi:hypothetical protein
MGSRQGKKGESSGSSKKGKKSESQETAVPDIPDIPDDGEEQPDDGGEQPDDTEQPDGENDTDTNEPQEDTNEPQEDTNEPQEEDDVEIDDRLDLARKVQITQPERPGQCMGYNSSLTSPLRLWECSSTGELDWWAVDTLDTLDSMSDDIFKLRHIDSDLCLPQNPEHPESAFNCFEHSGPLIAEADSINGLVNCTSPYAAVVGFLDQTNSLFLYNSDCLALGHNVTLMSHARTSETTVALWGEAVFLTMGNLAETYGLIGDWNLVDVL